LNQKAVTPSADKPETPPLMLFTYTGFTSIIQFLLYLRFTFLPFRRFVDAMLMIVRKLIPFLIVSLLLIWGFVFANVIRMRDDDMTCISIVKCFASVFALIFDFSPATIGPFEISFAFVVIIIQLNIMIAIVIEAWDSVEGVSFTMFWKYRIEKIYELNYITQLGCHKVFPYSNKASYWAAILRKKIDHVLYIPYSRTNDWEIAPLDLVRKRDHYENPHEYFDLRAQYVIRAAHSLNATLHWEKVEAKVDCRQITFGRKCVLYIRWFYNIICHTILIILGIPTFGFFWPEKFRSAIITLSGECREIRE